MALCKDEASGALVAALVDAKVAVAEKEYTAMQLQVGGVVRERTWCQWQSLWTPSWRQQRRSTQPCSCR